MIPGARSGRAVSMEIATSTGPLKTDAIYSARVQCIHNPLWTACIDLNASSLHDDSSLSRHSFLVEERKAADCYHNYSYPFGTACLLTSISGSLVSVGPSNTALHAPVGYANYERFQDCASQKDCIHHPFLDKLRCGYLLQTGLTTALETFDHDCIGNGLVSAHTFQQHVGTQPPCYNWSDDGPSDEFCRCRWNDAGCNATTTSVQRVQPPSGTPQQNKTLAKLRCWLRSATHCFDTSDCAQKRVCSHWRAVNTCTLLPQQPRGSLIGLVPVVILCFVGLGKLALFRSCFAYQASGIRCYPPARSTAMMLLLLAVCISASTSKGGNPLLISPAPTLATQPVQFRGCLSGASAHADYAVGSCDASTKPKSTVATQYSPFTGCQLPGAGVTAVAVEKSPRLFQDGKHSFLNSDAEPLYWSNADGQSIVDHGTSPPTRIQLATVTRIADVTLAEKPGACQDPLHMFIPSGCLPSVSGSGAFHFKFPDDVRKVCLLSCKAHFFCTCFLWQCNATTSHLTPPAPPHCYTPADHCCQMLQGFMPDDIVHSKQCTCSHCSVYEHSTVYATTDGEFCLPACSGRGAQRAKWSNAAAQTIPDHHAPCSLATNVSTGTHLAREVIDEQLGPYHVLKQTCILYGCLPSPLGCGAFDFKFLDDVCRLCLPYHVKDWAVTVQLAGIYSACRDNPLISLQHNVQNFSPAPNCSHTLADHCYHLPQSISWESKDNDLHVHCNLVEHSTLLTWELIVFIPTEPIPEHISWWLITEVLYATLIAFFWLSARTRCLHMMVQWTLCAMKHISKTKLLTTLIVICAIMCTPLCEENLNATDCNAKASFQSAVDLYKQPSFAPFSHFYLTLPIGCTLLAVAMQSTTCLKGLICLLHVCIWFTMHIGFMTHLPVTLPWDANTLALVASYGPVMDRRCSLLAKMLTRGVPCVTFIFATSILMKAVTALFSARTSKPIYSHLGLGTRVFYCASGTQKKLPAPGSQ